jgi:hypothetical protein
MAMPIEAKAREVLSQARKVRSIQEVRIPWFAASYLSSLGTHLAQDGL